MRGSDPRQALFHFPVLPLSAYEIFVTTPIPETLRQPTAQSRQLDASGFRCRLSNGCQERRVGAGRHILRAWLVSVRDRHRLPRGWDRGFESTFLQQPVCLSSEP